MKGLPIQNNAYSSLSNCAHVRLIDFWKIGPTFGSYQICMVYFFCHYWSNVWSNRYVWFIQNLQKMSSAMFACKFYQKKGTQVRLLECRQVKKQGKW